MISNDQNEKIGIAAKNALGFFEWLWNGIRSLFGKNIWTKVYLENSLGKNQKLYLKIDSLREEFLYYSNESHTLKKLRQHLAFALKDKLDEKTRLRISPNFFSCLRSTEGNKEEEIILQIKQLNDSPKERYSKVDNISLNELKELFHYIEIYKAQWIDEMNRENLSHLYLRHTLERIRTLRIERDGNVFIILKKVVGYGGYKKARLAINVNKKKLAVHATGKEIKEEIVDGKQIETNRREQLIIDFTTPAVHRNVVKQSSILFYTHCKEGKIIRKMAVTMSYFNEGNIFHLIKSNQTLTGDQKKQIVLDSLRGLKAIHDLGLIHGDVKPDNIFIKSRINKLTQVKEYSAKIGDFGFVNSPNQENSRGTPYYYSPEIWARVLQANSCVIKRTFASDCYSMGVSLGFFLQLHLKLRSEDYSNKFPFSGLILLSPLQEIRGAPEYLVSNLIERNPEKRIKLDDAIELAENMYF